MAERRVIGGTQGDRSIFGHNAQYPNSFMVILHLLLQDLRGVKSHRDGRSRAPHHTDSREPVSQSAALTGEVARPARDAAWRFTGRRPVGAAPAVGRLAGDQTQLCREPSTPSRSASRTLLPGGGMKGSGSSLQSERTHTGVADADVGVRLRGERLHTVAVVLYCHQIPDGRAEGRRRIDRTLRGSTIPQSAPDAQRQCDSVQRGTSRSASRRRLIRSGSALAWCVSKTSPRSSRASRPAATP